MSNNCPTKPDNSLRKAERISLQRTISLLYTTGQTIRAFPLKLIYLASETASRPAVSIITTVPKKLVKRANARNYVKRRIRESYRVRKHDLAAHIAAANLSLSIAFVYIDKEKLPFKTIDAAIAKGLSALIRKL